MLAIEAHAALARSLSEQLAAQAAALTESHARPREFERAQTLAEERQRLMRDMHDGLGAALTSSLIAVEHGGDQPQAVAGMPRDCMDEPRMVIDSLEPGEQDLVALLARLRFRLGRRFDAAGTRLDWQVDDLPPLPWLGAPEALQLLRILQEILVNALKHAGARCVPIATACSGDRVEVRCRDDGRGFDRANPPPGRRLPSLVQRCALLGAELCIDSAPDRGTDVCLRLPVGRPAGPASGPQAD